MSLILNEALAGSFALPYIAGAATGVEEMVQRAG